MTAGMRALGLSALMVVATPGVTFDRDGDGRADPNVVDSIGCRLPSHWHWATGSGFDEDSSGLLFEGSAGCPRPLAGDIDGDGRADVTVVAELPDSGDLIWLTSPSAGGDHGGLVFGHEGDEAFFVDFDGDGLSDPLIYRRRPGHDTEWHYKLSSTGTYAMVLWGKGDNTEFPVLEDFDADGITDIGVARVLFGAVPETILYWIIRPSSGDHRNLNTLWFGPQPAPSELWGEVGDMIVAGNFVGSAHADVAVVRGEADGHLRWFVDDTVAGAPDLVLQWGDSATDVPVPADYDGDGLTDIAIWRQPAPDADGQFWIRRSSDGQLTLLTYGKSGRDLPPTTGVVVPTAL